MAARSYRHGLAESLTNLAATLIAIAHTRLDLLSSDLEEQREHLTVLVALAITALFCLGMGIVLFTIFCIVAFWDTHRLLAVGTAAGVFLLGGGAACIMAADRLRSKPRFFAASLSELFKDRQQVIPRS